MRKKLQLFITSIIPIYAILPLLFCFTFNCIVYYGAAMLASSWKHYDFTLNFDRAVPLIPEFVIIYLGCYIFWIINYIMIMRQGKEYCMRFLTTDLMSRIICGIFFLLLPTTNIRPDLIGNDIFTILLKNIYTADPASNLFPSIHCLVSWFCYIGIRGQKNIPKFYRVFSCFLAILVFISTQVTKQHYIIDVIGAVIIAELTFYIGFHTNLYKRVMIIFDTFSTFLFRKIDLCETNDPKEERE